MRSKHHYHNTISQRTQPTHTKDTTVSILISHFIFAHDYRLIKIS